jgi:hypothetical protein
MVLRLPHRLAAHYYAANYCPNEETEPDPEHR